jgi:WD40 repeat protein
MVTANAAPCLFLSHSGADTEAVREMKRRLLESPEARAAGLTIWLDKDDLGAGIGWQAQIEKAIGEKTTAFAVHLGAKGVVNWVDSEVRLALSRAIGAADYPFIPILSRECEGAAALPPFAQAYQGVHDPLNNPDEFAKLLRAVLGKSPGEKTIALENPFVGLKSMSEADADRFFGRNEEIAGLVEKLKLHRLIAVVADSGAGKSSLAQAGLIPAFRGGRLSDMSGREPDDKLWHVVVMRPGRDPIEGLKRGVTEAAERLGCSADQCAGLRKRVDLADTSETAYAIRCDLPVSKTETLLIVDQFEELLTEAAEAARAPFVDFLMALAAGGGFRIVLTLRADHFNLCRPLANLFERLTRDNHDAVLRLGRITDLGIAEAVRKPLALAGHGDLAEQDAVIASIRRDISDRPGDLALVQMALYAMWQKHKADGADLLVAYAQVGGVAGALAHEAENVRSNRLDAAERELLAPVFVRLVRLGETGGATRRVADLTDFDPPRRALVGKLATEDCGRLLLAGETSVEIAHEALITQWPWLQNTLQQAAPDMRVLDRLMDKARRWVTTAGLGKADHLATGAEREEFAALAGRRPDWMSGVERDFVAASRRAYRRATIGRYAAVAALAVFAIGAASAAFVAIEALHEIDVQFVAAERAKQEAITERNQAQTTQSLFLASRSEQQREADPGTAMLLALEALPDTATGVARPYVPEAELQLDRAWRALRERLVLKGHNRVVWSAAFSPDGKRIVTAAEDDTARLWDAESSQQIGEPLTGHANAVLSAAFSPDGKRIVTASADRTARLWDVGSGQQIGEPLMGHTDAVQSAAFSPDGKRIVTASWDRTARVWDAENGKQIGEPLMGHTGYVTSASFSPDGRRIVTASRDRTARLWDAESGKQIGEPLTGHTHPVQSASFGPDGKRIVTASWDRTTRLWDAGSGKQIGEPLTGHTDAVQSAAFSPDGKRIVTASWDRTTRLWDAGSGKQIGEPLTGHTATVQSAAFSADGKRIVTASNDYTARLWDAGRGKQVGTPLMGHTGYVSSAAFSPDGKRIVTASVDRTARLWDAESGKQIGEPLAGHTHAVQSAAFSADGKRIVTASWDRTARLWDAESGKQIGEPLTGHTDAVQSAAFSADGKRIVTASNDYTARLWNAETGEQIGEPLTGHTNHVQSAAFSPDSKRIVTASMDETARLWDAESGKQIGEPLTGHPSYVSSAAFSADGKRIVTASWDKTARLWDAGSGKPIGEPLMGHTNYVSSATFSPDGKRILTASWDRTARLWDTESGKQIGEPLMRHTATVRSAAFSPDGKRTVTASDDKTVWLLRIFTATDEIVAVAKAASPRCLTTEQRHQFFLPAEPPAWCIEQEKWPYDRPAWKQWLSDSRTDKGLPLPPAP